MEAEDELLQKDEDELKKAKKWEDGLTDQVFNRVCTSSRALDQHLILESTGNRLEGEGRASDRPHGGGIRRRGGVYQTLQHGPG